MANVEYVLKARDEASAAVANLLRQFQGIDSTLASIQSVAGGAGRLGLIVGTIIATTGALIGAAKSVADTVEQLDRLESITGVSTDRLQAMQRVIRDGGGDADGFSASLVKLNRELDEGNPLFKQLGITSKDTFGAFMQLARVITQTSDAKRRDQIATQLLGKAGADLIPDLENLIDRFDGVYDAMSRTGGILDSEVMEQARNLDAQMETLATNWETAMTRMKAATVPVAAGIVSAFNDIWDAITGADKNPTIPDLERRLSEAESRVRSLLAEQNLKGADWNANSYRSAVKIAEKLRQELAKRKGVDLELERLKSRLEPPPPEPVEEDPLAALRERLRLQGLSAPVGRGEPSPRARYWDPLAGTEKALARTVRNMQLVEVPALRFGDSAQRVSDALDAMDAASSRMESQVVQDINRAISEIARGAGNIGQIFDAMMHSILASLAETALSMGVGLGLDFLGIAIGGPAGGFISGVGKKVAGVNSVAPAGGDTYYISTLNAKDLVQELTSPSGQLRRANDRIRDVAIAARR